MTTHFHVWADGRRVVLCQEHATPTRLGWFRNADGHNPNNPPIDPEPCTFGHCYVDLCWVGQISTSVTPCTRQESLTF